MVDLGRFALYFALPITLYAAIIPIIGVITKKRHLIQSARYAVYANALVLSTSAAGLITAFLTNRFDITYVFEYSNIALPTLYKLSAFYAGQAGSLLFWAWMLALYMAVVVYQNRRRNQDLMPYVMFIAMTVLFYFLFIMTLAPDLFTAAKLTKSILSIISIGLLSLAGMVLLGLALARTFKWLNTDSFKKHYKDYMLIGLLVFIILFFVVMGVMAKQPSYAAPFQTIKQAYPDATRMPVEGQGLNPLLQNYGMFFHPPTLYMGYVGFTIPFAFAIAALITRNLGSVWITSTRKWTIFAWFFLGVGIVFGAQWAYMELGWGGYWMWDPVENASFMPWLVGTAFLHSVMIQEKKNMLKVWNMLLIVFTFALSLFGTFLTRSGVLSSVHTFGSSSLGGFFLVAILLSLVPALFLLATRLDSLKSQNELDSLLSREASFLINNLLLVGAAFTVFWGTVFPLISEALTGKKPTVGPPFYETVMVPIAFGLFLITAICPLIAWRRATHKNLVKNFSKPFGFSVAVGLGLALFIGASITQQVGFLAGLIALAALVLVYFFNEKLVFPTAAVVMAGAGVYFAINSGQVVRFILPGFLAAALIGSTAMVIRNRQSGVGLGYMIASISGIALFLSSLKISHPWTLASFFLLTFIAATIILEFYRGTRIRFRNDKERAGVVGFVPFDILRVFKALGTLIWKNKRRYGGYVIHTGIVLMFIGVTASSTWSVTKEATLREGESMKINDYVLNYKQFDAYKTANKEVFATTLEVWKDVKKDGTGTYMGETVAEKNFFPNPYKDEKENQPMTEIGLFWNLKEDLYVILSGYDFKSKVASFKVKVNPMVVWIWIGGLVMCLGTVVTMWPDATEKRRLAAKYGSSA